MIGLGLVSQSVADIVRPTWEIWAFLAPVHNKPARSGSLKQQTNAAKKYCRRGGCHSLESYHAAMQELSKV